MAQDRRLEHPCRGIVPVAVQGMAEFVEGVLPASFSGAYLGAGEISRILPRGVPCGFVEEVVGFAPAVPVFQAESQVVYGLAVVGVLVASGQDFHRLAQIAFGLVEARPPQIPEPQGVVVAYVGRVAPQRLLVVVQGAPGRMPVLLKVQTCQIQLLAASDFRGLERRFGGIGHRSREIVLGLAAQSVDAEDYLVEGAAVAADHTLVHDFRRQREFFRVEFLAVPAAHGDAAVLPRGGERHDPEPVTVFRKHVEHEVAARVLDYAELAIGEEVLSERLLLIGHEPAEVGLVLGVDSGHQFDVWTVAVGQVPVPGAAEVAVTPGPLLLAWAHVMVGDMQHAGPGVVLPAALEVIFRVGDHVGCRHRDVPVVADIHPCAVVHLVVHSRCDGEGAHGALAVIEDGVHVGREHTLVGVVHVHRRVSPPEEGLGQLCRIVEHSLYLEVGAAGPQGEACHAFLVEHPLPLADPDGHAAVGILLYAAVHRHEGAGPVVLGPVEFYASAYPGAGETHERGLYHMIVVDEMSLGDLVPGHLDASSELRKYHDLDIFVFEPHCVVLAVLLLVGYRFYHLIGVHDAAAALIDSLLKEYRVLLGFPGPVGRNDDLLSPCFYHSVQCVSSFSSCSSVFPLVSGQLRRK